MSPFCFGPAGRCLPRHQTRRALRLTAAGFALALLALSATDVAAQPRRGRGKLDQELTRRSSLAASWRHSKVVVQLVEGQTLPAALKQYQKGDHLGLINGYVLDLPDTALAQLDSVSELKSAHLDRPVWAADFYSTRATYADVAQQTFGYSGVGVGVAVIDSGVTTWHDDLQPNPLRLKSFLAGNQRVTKFVDFVGGQRQAYDDHGHGSHVAGVILGNGFDSLGRHTGMAPDASLVALKALDGDGKGTISGIIAALDWVAVNARTYNIRVVNLSAGAAVTESYWTDPLTLAAKRLVDRGIVVVAAAGNLGANGSGAEQYGGILCPGNAPWVLTVGASSTRGTVVREDDQVAGFSSRGPTRGDYLAKPDLVAPGHGILSLSSPGSTLFSALPQFLADGLIKTGYQPYLSLSGTSMAAPQVAGALAMMFEANPKLTPNLAKAILQYTAQTYEQYNALEQGAGFLDVLSAVRLAKFYANNRPGARMPVQATWSQHVLWGNHLISGGYINPLGNAWKTSTVWGADVINTSSGEDNIVWGTACGAGCDNIVWGTADSSGDNIVWGTASGEDNIVWGTTSAGEDNIVWGTASGEDNIVWGTSSGGNDNIVWGTDCGGGNCRNVVWGSSMSGADNIVWGTASGEDNIVWGTASGEDNIVWGTAAGGEDNIVWGTSSDGRDNIVWGTSGEDNIVWGTASGEDNIVWGTATVDNVVWR
jgi:serine protease AprX